LRIDLASQSKKTLCCEPRDGNKANDGMLAALFTGKEEFELKEIHQPPCSQGGLVVKVNACAICGTDLKTLRKADVKMENGKPRQMTLPRITGHEISGTVVEAGSQVKGYQVGDRVVVAPTAGCGSCHWCRKGHSEMCANLKVIGYDCDGGFAEYIGIEKDIIDAQCVINIAETADLDEAALTEPLSCALNCLELSPILEGDIVIIIGAGPLGCFLGDLAKLKKAGQVILADLLPEQLEAARVCGADVFVDTSKEDLVKTVMDITDNRGAEVVITACPSGEVQKQALLLVSKRGRINFFGGLPRDNSIVCLDTNLIHYKECLVAGTHGSRPEHIRQALRLIEKKQIQLGKYISHRFKLEDINKAIKIARKGKRLKILIKPATKGE